MRLIMIRHGEPDYEKDCLTPAGKKQAEAVSLRLEREGISQIWSSPMGRALGTAEYTAKRLGLEVHVLDFMHEISWGGPGVPESGHPWTLSERMLAEENYDFLTMNWREHPYYRDNEATVSFDRVSACFDQFLAGQGYRHEGRHFLCGENTDRTVALFSHGGSGACVLAHMLSLPFPYVISVLSYDFTSVIILNFPDRPGQYVCPRLELFNDTAHLQQTVSVPHFQP